MTPQRARQTNKIYPKKYLSQNFLVNPHFQKKIAESYDLKPTDIVLEIGPGTGLLTSLIAPHVKHVFAVEKDKQLAVRLNEQYAHSNVTIINADILKYPLHDLPAPLKVIGNLPYHISTPIVTKIIEAREQCPSLYITVQLEYGQRLAAQPGSKDYGALSCFVQYYANTKVLFKIPPTAFNPKPKVQSCFVECLMRKEPAVATQNEELFFKIIRLGFQQRRKMLINALSDLKKKEELIQILKHCGISQNTRVESLSLEQFARLVNLLMENPDEVYGK